MELVAGGVSDVGMVRHANEDSWLIGDRLWAVADGMGGHQGGEVASRLSIEILSEHFDEFSAEALVEAAQAANAAVHDRASEHSDLRGMGTTLCAMGLIDTDDGSQALEVINIGDSRCYRWRDRQMTQITRDHSLVEDMRAAGQITDAEAALHPHRNIVTRALGIQPRVKVDSFQLAPVAGDRYVLCSDGLFNEVPVDRIAATLRRLADPQEAAAELVRQANEAGGRDNVTCVVVDVLDAAGAIAIDDVDAEVDGDDVAEASPGGHRELPPDVAGITTAVGKIDLDDEGSVTARSVGDDADHPRVRLRRATWRTVAFVVVLIAIVAVAVAAIGWYSRGTYFLAFDSGEVTVFKGRPGGVLWFSPTVAERTGIARNQVPATLRDAIADGKQQSTLADAEAYLAHMRSMICSELANGAQQPPLGAGAPTTTLPQDCADKPAASSGSSPGSTSVPPSATSVATTVASSPTATR